MDGHDRFEAARARAIEERLAAAVGSDREGDPADALPAQPGR